MGGALMLFTKREAISMQCPGPGNCGRRLSETHRTCIADGCIAWRWADLAHQVYPDSHNASYKPPGEGWMWSESNTKWFRPTPHRRGYCGLMGKPC